jgi:antibiotic biosynthesis monooxygenase (ABM) superfamily enzyme
VTQWLKKLQEPTRNPIWKNTILFYALLLTIMVKVNQFYPPFKNVPCQGSLPNITKYDVVTFSTLIYSRISFGIRHTSKRMLRNVSLLLKTSGY